MSTISIIHQIYIEKGRFLGFILFTTNIRILFVEDICLYNIKFQQKSTSKTLLLSTKSPQNYSGQEQSDRNFLKGFVFTVSSLLYVICLE